MSSFEDYTRTSRDYDQTRQVVGLDSICGCLLAAGLDMQHSRILDAGCGTGSYARALAPFVQQVIGIDRNAGMLAQARSKLAREIAAGKVELREGDLTSLQLPGSSFDAVMLNQVLHHLPDTREDHWHIRRQLFAELARVLRPGAVLVLNTCQPQQLRRGWWFYPLIPKALERMCERHLERSEIVELLTDAGFDYQGCNVPVDAVLQGAHYFDSQGPRQQRWRNGDSIWADVRDQELHEALKTLAQLHADGAISGLLADHERQRLEVGQVSFFHAIRRSPSGP